MRYVITHNRLFSNLRIQNQLKKRNLNNVFEYYIENREKWNNNIQLMKNSLVIQTYPRSGTEYTCDLLIKLINLLPVKEENKNLYHELKLFENEYGDSLFWSSASIGETIYRCTLRQKPDIYLFKNGNYISAIGGKKIIKQHHYHKSNENINTIHVIRFPFDTIKSHFLSHQKNNLNLKMTDELLTKYVNEWKYAVSRFIKNEEQRKNCLIIRFEDFIMDFKKTVEKIFFKFGIPDLQFSCNGLHPFEIITKKHIFWNDDYSFYSKEQNKYILSILNNEIRKCWPEKIIHL